MCFINPKNHGHGHDQENLNSWQGRIYEVALYLEELHDVSGNAIRVFFLSLFPECSQPWAGGAWHQGFGKQCGYEHFVHVCQYTCLHFSNVYA